ncbi:lipoprotein [Candidatus Thalassolituus haligoni]|tara:strand:- start:7949 stop:8086 length:138 start_codon:yes stop_codon:yes gene_type:complete
MTNLICRLPSLPLLTALLLAALVLSGCGQKGPLYLPDQPDTETTR